MATEHAQFRFIPARCLALSPLNVRKSASEEGIEQLAELIAAEGVLQNLNVYEQVSDDSGTTHAVIAGGRRWRALNLLIAQKRIEPDHQVPCMVVSYERAVQISLSENSGREPMHPADEFEAFRHLIDAGQSVEDVAARFGVTALVVQRRLRLANVSPQFIAWYRQGEVTLEHLMALAVTDEHEHQEQVWKGLKSYERSPSGIRQALTEHEVSARAPLARFVGIKAYEKAGGVVRRDLFEQEGEGVMLDGDLVRRLATEKLEKHAKRLKAEGFAWIDVRPEFDYASRANYGRVHTTLRARNAEEQGQLDTLRATRERLETEQKTMDADGDEYDARVSQLEEIDSQIDALEEQRTVPDPEQRSVAGAVVSIGRDGKVSVERDLLRPEDVERVERARRRCKRETPCLHSATLVERLTAQRTLALQAELVQQPMTAVIALTHRLVLSTFYGSGSISGESAVRIEVGSTLVSAHAAELAGTAAQETLAAHRKLHERTLPQGSKDLLAWITALPAGDLLSLLAYCVAVTVDGVQSKEGPCAVDALAKAAKLDMHRWWKPTAENYFRSISKSQILAVMTEAVSAPAATAVAKLKKEALAQAAERQLADKSWLPALLRNGAV
jgi:ParB family transcriptional regulator, chromosome partitioning protein